MLRIGETKSLKKYKELTASYLTVYAWLTGV